MPTLVTATVVVGMHAVGCASTPQHDPVRDSYPEAQAEVRAALSQIHHYVETANTDALQQAHLQSEKFSKFGGRGLGRMDIEQCNQQEAMLITSMDEVAPRWDDLKIDVFGDVAIPTGTIQISFKTNGEDNRSPCERPSCC